MSVDGGKTLEEIAQRFELPRSRATEITRFLVENGLCLKTKDHFKMGLQRIHIDRESTFASKHHLNWRVKAIQRSENIEAEELMFTAPISISHEDFQILRELLVEFIKNASDRVSKSEAVDVACLNLDLFWIK